jgi:hypothetical protein
MARGIGKNGVILRALRGTMPKFERRSPRALAFRSLLILAGALMMLAAFAPRANADLIVYFNFEDAGAIGNPPDFTSEFDQGLGVNSTITTNYAANGMDTGAGLPLNVAAGDTDANNFALRLRRTASNNGAHFDIPLFTSMGFFSNMTLTFAYNTNGNGFTTVTLVYSTDFGATFTTTTGAPTQTLINAGTNQLGTIAVPAGANGAPGLVIRLVFTGGASNGNNGQTLIDNIQIGGTIVPEPATVAGGLLGVLGLCWFQRRRLIRSVRFRRT